ncbi:MAG: YetF domain-containing protein [Bryobacteraceae bacterium]
MRFVFRHRRLDQLLEGPPQVLIDGGKIDNRALAKELMSVSELTIVAHRQGFQSLDQVERCVLEPGGTFHMVRKAKATKEGEDAVLLRLDQILAGLRQLRAAGNNHQT